MVDCDSMCFFYAGKPVYSSIPSFLISGQAKRNKKRSKTGLAPIEKETRLSPIERKKIRLSPMENEKETRLAAKKEGV